MAVIITNRYLHVNVEFIGEGQKIMASDVWFLFAVCAGFGYIPSMRRGGGHQVKGNLGTNWVHRD